jgi:hypothetical protein
MKIRVEGTGDIGFQDIDTNLLMSFLGKMCEIRIEDRKRLTRKVEDYEKTRAAREMAYHAMSPLRRFLAGKKPDHHLAAEYIAFVKRPLQEVSRLTGEIRSIQQAEEKLLQGASEITLTRALAEEVKNHYGRLIHESSNT